MSTKWIVVAEAGDGTASYSPRFLFDDESAATALVTRLNRAATSVFTLHGLPQQRRDPQHDALYACALDVLRSLDATAEPTTLYAVKAVESYVEPTEGAPDNAAVALFRSIRDLAL